MRFYVIFFFWDTCLFYLMCAFIEVKLVLYKGKGGEGCHSVATIWAQSCCQWSRHKVTSLAPSQGQGVKNNTCSSKLILWLIYKSQQIMKLWKKYIYIYTFRGILFVFQYLRCLSNQVLKKGKVRVDFTSGRMVSVSCV